MPDFDTDIRKLIITQLNVIDRLISEVGIKVDRYHQSSRQLTLDIAKGDQAHSTALHTQISALQIRAKVWGAVLSFIAGFIAAHVVTIILHMP